MTWKFCCRTRPATRVCRKTCMHTQGATRRCDKSRATCMLVCTRLKKSIYALSLYDQKKWCHIKKSIDAVTLYNPKKWCHIKKSIYALTLYNPKKWCHIKKSIYALTLYNLKKLCHIKKSIYAPSICAQKHLLCTERMTSLRKIYCPGGQFICAEQQKPSWSSVSVVMATHYFKSQNAFFLFCALDRTPFFGTTDGEESLIASENCFNSPDVCSSIS